MVRNANQGNAVRTAAAWLVVVIAIAVAACTKSPVRYDLPPPANAQGINVEVEVTGAPRIITPHNEFEGFFGGAIAGAYHDCLFWFCLPVMATAGALAGLATSSGSASINRVDSAIRNSDAITVVRRMLVEAIVAEGNAMGTFNFVARYQPGADGDTPATAGNAYDDATKRRRSIVLLIEPTALGIGADGFDLALLLDAKGRLDDQDIEQIQYRSAPQKLDYWTIKDGENIVLALQDAVNSVADSIVSRVFVATTVSDSRENK